MCKKKMTVSEIAKKVGVSRQAVHQKIKREPLSSIVNPILSTKDRKLYIVDDDIDVVIDSFNDNNVKTDVNTFTSIDVKVLTKDLQHKIELLEFKLEVKSNKIEDLEQEIIKKDKLIKDKEKEIKEQSITIKAKDESIEKSMRNLENLLYQQQLLTAMIENKNKIIEEKKENKESLFARLKKFIKQA